MSTQSKALTDQHYVPQLLLKGFASQKRKQLYVFDKSTEKVFRSSVRNLACERGFYHLENGEDPNRVDRWLGQLEEATAPIIRSVRTQKTLNHLKTAERQWLAAFIAVQHVRTRHHRESWGDINKQMADALREMGAEPNSVENFRELTQSEIRETSIGDVPRLAFTLLPHILNKSWILLAAAPGTDFWIGDHPVVLENNMNPGDGIRGTLGFAIPGIEIYLPVSSELTLGCLCPTIPAMFASAQVRFQQSAFPAAARSEQFLRALTGSGTLQLDAQNVKYHNSLQAIRAERFVFGQHQEFNLLQQMIANDPTLKAGPRIEIVGRPRRPK
jgi:uncharacterized protein DUF4238